MTMRSIKTAALQTVDQVRLEANKQLNPQRKVELGQFMTPASVARFMASLFSPRTGAVRLLDAGAGVGSLTDAFINRWGSESVAVYAYEIDPTLAAYLRETLNRHGKGTFRAQIIGRDFIQEAVYRITLGNLSGERFTHAILNP